MKLKGGKSDRVARLRIWRRSRAASHFVRQFAVDIRSMVRERSVDDLRRDMSR